jgi:peptidoglycan/LPS O-acetylase OafA/YrhL
MTAPKRIVALEGLRGVAALLVVADHAVKIAAEKIAGISEYVDLAWYLGLLGVTAFFAISGMVMITVHGEDFGRPGAARYFLQKRLTRIVPLYWLATALYVTNLYLAHHGPILSDIVQSLLFIPHQGDGREFGWPVYGLGWTLQFEMIFYLVFAACLSLPKKIGLSLVVATFPVLTALHYGGFFERFPIMIYVSRPITLLFVVGVLIGVIRAKYFKSVSFLSFNQSMLFCLGFMGLSIILADFLRATRPDYAMFAVCVGGALAVAGCAMSKLGEKMSIAERIAIWVGEGSYAIYLSHTFLLGPLAKLTGKFYHNCPVQIFVIMGVILAIPLGLLTFRLVEKPILRYLGRFTKKPAAIATVPTDPLLAA